MRTTVTLDPDTEHLIRQRMREKGVSFKRAINDAIREGASGRQRTAYQTPTFEMGLPALDLTKALQLADEIEDEARLRDLRRGG